MAWERSFKKRILNIRDKELKYQKLNYTIEVPLFNYISYTLLSDARSVHRLSGMLPGSYSSKS